MKSNEAMGEVMRRLGERRGRAVCGPVTLYLDTELYSRAKGFCKLRNLKMSRLMDELMRVFLEDADTMTSHELAKKILSGPDREINEKYGPALKKILELQ